jgi:hypothetical protein
MPCRTAARLVLALALATAACGDRAQGAQQEPRDPEPPKVDPCALLTDAEISDQLWLTLQPSERQTYKPQGFDVKKNEVPWGISRRCEFGYQSKAQVSGGPALRGVFNVMVSGKAMADAVPDRQKKPIPGVGDEAFRHQQTWYVRKGDLVASVTDFRGTNEPGVDPDAGRVAFLKLMAQRLN